MLRQRALDLIDRVHKRARLCPPDSHGMPCALGAQLAREHEAVDVDPTLYDRKDDARSPGQQSARNAIAQQVDQLRRQYASAQFPEMAARALATRLAAAEENAAASDSSGESQANALVAAIQQLQQSREFNRLRFAAHFLGSVDGRPSLRTIWRLHTSQVVPIEQLIEAASDASLDSILLGVRSLADDELRNGRDDAMILPGLFRELLAIVHTSNHFGTGGMDSGKAPGVARKILSTLTTADEVFSLQLDAVVLIQLKLLRVAADLASEPVAGSAPALQLLEEQFLHYLTHPHPAAATDGDSLSVLSHVCLQPCTTRTTPQATVMSPGWMRNEIVALFVAHAHLSAGIVATAIDRVMRREETDWSFLVVLVPKVIKADPSIVPVLLENLRAVFNEATAEMGVQGVEKLGGSVGRILSSITLLRFILLNVTQDEKHPDMQAQYKRYLDCFRESFVVSGAGGSVKKSVLALVRALTVQVPREGVQYLKLHIAALNPRNNVAPNGCREAIRAYIALAKTRLSDLGETAALIGNRVNESDQAGSSDEVKKEIQGYVAEFKRTGLAPRAIFSQFMFRKNWWQLSAEPVLLVPISADVETRSAQRQLIEALAQDKKTKVVREGALETFDLACVAGHDDDETGTDGPGARLAKLLAQYQQIWKQWSSDRASAEAEHSAGSHFCDITGLCGRIKKTIAQLDGAAKPDSGSGSEEQLAAVALKVLESFCVSYGHALTGQSVSSQGDDGARTMYEYLTAFCAATHRLRDHIWSRLVRIVTVTGASEIEQNTCDGVALYLALDSCRVIGLASTDAQEDLTVECGTGGVDTSLTALDNLFGAIPWWKSRAWLHWFLRFSASYTRAVLSACDALHTRSVRTALRARTADECAAYLPLSTLLQPSLWLVDRTRVWLADTPRCRVLSRAPQSTSVSVVGSAGLKDGETAAVTDTAAFRWLVGDWTELINVLTLLGINLSLDTLPLESWIRYETRLCTCADYFSTPQKLDYLRARVFDVYLVEHGGAAISVAVLRGLLASCHTTTSFATTANATPTPSAALSPPETDHCFLLLIQEVASLSVHVPSAQIASPSPFSPTAAVTGEFQEAGAAWLLHFVASEYERLGQLSQEAGTGGDNMTSRKSRRLEQLMSYCLMLPPTLLWSGGASEADPTRGLDVVWDFIDRALLQPGDRRTSRMCSHWSGALATHVCKGLFHHCHTSAVIESVRQWLHVRPRLMAALLTPHWRLVFSTAEAMLGKRCKEELLGSWETTLYAAEDALTPCPPHPDETMVAFFSVVAEDPVKAAVALCAICLRAPAQEDVSESVSSTIGERVLAADITVGIVKQLFADAAALPCFRATTGQSNVASSTGGGRLEADYTKPVYDLHQNLAPVQRAAVTFVQLLASRCMTVQPSVQPEHLGSLAYSAAAGPLDLEAWLAALCWRLLVCLVETVPWLLLAVGGEPSLRDLSGTHVFSSAPFEPTNTPPQLQTASNTEQDTAPVSVLLTLAEWMCLDSLCDDQRETSHAKVVPGEVLLSLCGSQLSACLMGRAPRRQSEALEQPKSLHHIVGAGLDGDGARRMVAIIDKLVGTLSTQSLRNLPPRTIDRLVVAVPHLAHVLRN